MIGGGPQKITVEIGGKIAASLGRSLRDSQRQVSSFGRNVTRTMNDAAIAGKKGFKGIFDNALWQQASVGAASVGLALAGSVRVAARFEASLTDISKTAQLTTQETRKLGQEILKLTGRNETNQSAEQLAAGIKTLTGAGLELKDAMVAIRGIGRVATATGSDINDVANTSYQLMQNLKIASGDVARTFEILALAGKRGSFELKDMATLLPTVASSANSLGVTGVKGAASLAAALQITRRGAGDASTAANNLVNLLQKIQSPDAVKNFKKFGVNIEQVTKNARAKGLNPLEETLKEIQRVTGGDQFKVSQIFGDMQVKNALMPLLRDFEDYIKIRDEALGAKGVIGEDYQKSLATFQGTLTSFQNSAQRLGITVGNSLLPPLTRLAERITPVVEGIGAWASANPGLAKNLVLVGGAISGLTLALPVIAGVVSAIGVLSGPVTLAILGVGAAIGLIVANWGAMKKAAIGAWESITATWGRFTGWVGNIFTNVLTMSRNLGQRVITAIIDGLKAKVGVLFGWIRNTWSSITGFFSGSGGGGSASAGASSAGGTYRGGGRSSMAAPGRALGGRVFAGQPYTVGERRRELFVPGMDGAIIPRIARPVTAGNQVTIHAPVTIHASGDGAGIREQVRQAFEDLMAMASGGYRVALND